MAIYSGHLNTFVSYICEHGTLVGAQLYVRGKSGVDRFCTVTSADDPRRVRIGAKVAVHYEGFDERYDEELQQTSDRIICLVGSFEHRAQMRQQFSQLDRDGNGTLSFSELRQLFSQITPHRWSDASLHRLYDSVDTDKSGAVDLDEFIDWIMTGRKLPPRPRRKSSGEGDESDATLQCTLGITIKSPSKEESDAAIEQRAKDILENPGNFFEGGTLGGGGTLVTVSAMLLISAEPLLKATRKGATSLPFVLLVLDCLLY